MKLARRLQHPVPANTGIAPWCDAVIPATVAASPSVVASPGSSIPVGELLVCYGTTAATALTSLLITDSGTNPWTYEQSTGAVNSELRIAASVLTTGLTSSSTLTWTKTGGSASSLGIGGASFQGAAANADSAAYAGAVLAADTTNALNVTVSTSASVNPYDLVFCAMDIRAVKTLALPAGWTSLGSASAASPATTVIGAFMVAQIGGIVSVTVSWAGLTPAARSIAIVAFPHA